MFLPNATVSSSPNIKHLEALNIFPWVLWKKKYLEKSEILSLWASHLFVYRGKGVYHASHGSTE